MKPLTYALLALTIFILLYLIFRFIFRRRLATSYRLADIEAVSFDIDSGLDISALTGQQEDFSRIFSLPVLGRYVKKSYGELVQAHILMRPTEFLLISLLSALISFLLLFVLTGIAGLALIFGIFGFFVPKLYISSAKNKRAKQLNNQLPEFLNILSNGLRAGLSFTQAIASSSDEMEDPIRWELKKVLRDNTLGRPMEDALNDLVVRTGDEDIEMFVTAINIQLQIGGNLSQVLDMIAETIRARVKLKGDVRTLTAQSRMSAAIIGLLPIGIALAISMLNPGYLNPLFTEPLGQILVGAAIVMTLIGALLLRKISQLEV